MLDHLKAGLHSGDGLLLWLPQPQLIQTILHPTRPQVLAGK